MPNWAKVNQGVAGFREALKDQKFETV
jgi:hypothetical protein